MYCSNCGEQIRDGAKFCSNCGAECVCDEKPVVSEFNETIQMSAFTYLGIMPTITLDQLTAFCDDLSQRFHSSSDPKLWEMEKEIERAKWIIESGLGLQGVMEVDVDPDGKVRTAAKPLGMSPEEAKADAQSRGMIETAIIKETVEKQTKAKKGHKFLLLALLLSILMLVGLFFLCAGTVKNSLNDDLESSDFERYSDYKTYKNTHYGEYDRYYGNDLVEELNEGSRNSMPSGTVWLTFDSDSTMKYNEDGILCLSGTIEKDESSNLRYEYRYTNINKTDKGEYYKTAKKWMAYNRFFGTLTSIYYHHSWNSGDSFQSGVKFNKAGKQTVDGDTLYVFDVTCENLRYDPLDSESWLNGLFLLVIWTLICQIAMLKYGWKRGWKEGFIAYAVALGACLLLTIPMQFILGKIFKGVSFIVGKILEAIGAIIVGILFITFFPLVLAKSNNP